MDIYIKSFNRPYLLHRTLASIEKMIVNYQGKVIVLDDGTPEKYLWKIQQLFPEIEIRKSPYYIQKSNEITAGKYPQKKIPAMFWRDEVLKGSDRFILLEDDMWFSKRFDYNIFKEDTERLNMDMIKFLWLQNPVLLSENITETSQLVHKVAPRVLTKNACFFKWLFRTGRFKWERLYRVFINTDTELLKYYQLYVVAGALYSKRFYETCWTGRQDTVNELYQIEQLLQSRKKFNVGNSREELLKATYKTTASFIEKDRFGNALDVFKLNRVLNDAWYEGRAYRIDDFSNDLDDNWIKDCIGHVDELRFEVWQNWYSDFKTSYENFGCKL